jgi:hypothetical protein
LTQVKTLENVVVTENAGENYLRKHTLVFFYRRMINLQETLNKYKMQTAIKESLRYNLRLQIIVFGGGRHKKLSRGKQKIHFEILFVC